MINYQQISFSGAYGTADQLPASTRPEVAFAGRSNVGKSSIMNRVFSRKNLVRVSSKPGKTTTVNFFTLPEADFVDLPGYGFAKVAKREKERWSSLIDGYFAQNRQFALVVALVDIRHDASPLDRQMVAFLEERELPYAVAFTKADKLSRAAQQRQVRALCAQLAQAGAADAPIVTCSAVTGAGVDDLRSLIEECVIG